MLTVKQVQSITKPGRHPDRDGLYLQVSRTGTKSWIYRYQLRGKRVEMGLGPLSALTLKEAREAAAECRRLRDAGVDPRAHRQIERHRIATEAQDDGIWTFDRCAAAFIEAKRAEWKNEKHAAQWQTTLETYASPIIGVMPVDEIDTAAVLSVLKPIWHTKPETASRVRGRIESVLGYAGTLKLREGPNPALWRGHLSTQLPKRSKVKAVEHHNALPYAELPEFWKLLEASDSISSLALRFTILTACRTNEVIAATWDEFDRKAGTWTIPADRMKAGREHRVPLSKPALAILSSIDGGGGGYAWPGKKDRPLSNMAMLRFLQHRLERPDLTVHGFRSTFRDWSSEQTDIAPDVCEAALAHTVRSATEAAYRRGDLFDKRRKLMNAWARYCTGG